MPVEPPKRLPTRCSSTRSAAKLAASGTRSMRSITPGTNEGSTRVPDAASYAALRVLEQRVGKRFGGSTGTDFCGALQLACELRAQGQAGSIVTLACDGG